LTTILQEKRLMSAIRQEDDPDLRDGLESIVRALRREKPKPFAPNPQ
jgi:hypothetical protein